MAVKVRYRKIKNNRYNIYLDIYKEGTRTTETLPGYVVSKDYSRQSRQKYINKQDEEFVIKANAKAAERNTELLTGELPSYRRADLFHLRKECTKHFLLDLVII